MADKDEDVKEITVPSQEVQYGRESRYMELESQQILLGGTVEVEHTTSQLTQVTQQQQQQFDLMSAAATPAAPVTSGVAPLPPPDSQYTVLGPPALGPSPAQGSVGTVSTVQTTTDVTSTVKMRTQSRSTVERQQRLGDRLTQPSEHDTEQDRKRDSTHILEKFEEQAKSFQEQMLLLPSKPKKARAPSPGIFRQSVGLDHLDNLVRLMEQLTQLRDENSRLKKRCEYLENTKSLLQVRTLMGGQEIPGDGPPPAPAGYLTLPTTSKPKQRRMSEDLGGTEPRPRLASAEDSQCLEVEGIDGKLTSVEVEPVKRLHKRSYSTGSIDVPDGVMSSEEQVSTANGAKHGEHLADISKTSLKHKKMSKWAKVKKVFSGHKSTEEVGGAVGGTEPEGGITLTVPDLTGPDVADKHLLSTPHVGLSESRSVDSGVGSGLEGADTLRMSTSSGEPSSPSRKMAHSGSSSSQQDAPGESGAESWIGPSGWEECQSQRQGSFASNLSEEGSSADGKSSKAHSAKEGKEKAQYLQVDSRYPYVRRSSSLEGLDDLQKTIDLESRQARLHRSASTKSDGKSPSPDGDGSGSSKEKKLHRSAWGRVKDIIHTRKDSLKKRTKKGDKSDSEISEGIEYSDFLADLGETSEGKVSPKSSTKTRNGCEATRRSVDSGGKKSPRTKGSGSPPSQVSLLPPQHGHLSFDVSQLMGAMTEEYVKKMQEWEEKKSRKPMGSRGSVSPAKSKEHRSKESTPEGAVTPVETPWHSINVDEIQRNLTESFHRKLQEWERMKYRRDHSPLMERKSGASAKKKEERKLKKSKSEKEKEKLDRIREREIHRVEKEVQKLEREKIRLEKERLKALEKEAKIEKMKGRLSQADIETKLKHPILGPLSEYKVTAEFARKLHEWEVRKGMSQEASTSLYLEIQKRSMELADEMYHGEAPKHSRRGGHRRGGSADTLSPPVSPVRKDAPVFTLEGSEERVEGELERQLSDESSLPPPEAESSSSVTEEGLTSINIVSLEKANVSLMEELRKKENEYMKAQLEVHSLNQKLQTMKDSHTRTLVTYKQEMETLQQGEQPLPQVSLTDLEGKIQELETFGDRVVLSMESAAICKFQSIEGEEAVGDQLMELVDQMKSMLSKVSHTEEASKRSSMMHDFEKLYSHAMQLQVQMNNLRLSHLERNKEIMDLKRQLLLQEVTNLLLQVDITRRETELTHYKESKQRSLKRSSTFSDLDPDEKADTEEASPKPPLHRYLSLKEPLQYEQAEVEGERSPKSPVEGDTSREHTLDVFFPFEGRARSSTTSADSTELSSAKSGDTGSMSDDPFIASLPTSESVELLPPEQRGAPAVTAPSSLAPEDGRSVKLPVLKLQPVPPAKTKPEKQEKVDSLEVLPELSDIAVILPEGHEDVSVSEPDQQQDTGMIVLPVEADTGEKLTEQTVTGVILPEPGTGSIPVGVVLPQQQTIAGVILPEQLSTTGVVLEPTVTDDTSMLRDQTSGIQVDDHLQVPEVSVDAVQPGVSSDLVAPPLQATLLLDQPSEIRQSPLPSSEPLPPEASIAQSVTIGKGSEEAPDRPKTVVLTQPAKLRQDSTSRLFAQSARLKTDSSHASAQHTPTSAVPVTSHVIYSSSQLHSKLPRGEKLSEWLKREPKLPKLVIPDYKKMSAESDKPRLQKSPAVDEDPHDPFQPREVPVTGLPPSPVIRSRQTRRLRAEEKLNQQKHSSSDLARLPATPPRNNRHRMAKQEQALEDQQNGGRRSLYVTSDPNLQIPLPSMELLKQSQDLDANSRSAPDGFPRTSQKDISPQADIHKPISDMISKFEKQSSLESSTQSAIVLRKTPSPTIVPHVSPLRKLKPAAELLQESQKSKGRALSPRGHVHRLEAMTQRTQSEENTSSTRSQNKENVSEISYVQTMVHRLSRETTPERRLGSKDSTPRSGSSGVIRSDSPRSNSEFVQHIVRKLSTTTTTTTTESELNRSLSPLKDLTNDGQVKSLTEAFSAGSSRSSPERSALPTSPSRSRAILVRKPRSASSSCSPPVSRAVYPRISSPSQPGKDLGSMYERHGMGSVSPTSPRSPPPSRGRFVGLSQPIPYKPDSAISVTCSLPSTILTSAHPHTSLHVPGHSALHSAAGSPLVSVIPEERTGSLTEDLPSLDSPAELTCTTLSPERTRNLTEQTLKPQERLSPPSPEIEVLEKNIRVVTPEPDTPGRSKSPTSPRFKRSLFSKGTQGGKKSSAQKLPPVAPRTGEKQHAQAAPGGGGKGLRGTIGALCQQAMSFDLGVSLHLSKDQDHDRIDFRKSDPVKLPSDCAQGMPPKSPSAHSDDGGLSPQPAEEKGKSKGKFLDYSWLQKSKKLFKVSNPPPSSSPPPEDSSCQVCHGRPGDSTCSLCCR